MMPAPKSANAAASTRFRWIPLLLVLLLLWRWSTPSQCPPLQRSTRLIEESGRAALWAVAAQDAEHPASPSWWIALEQRNDPDTFKPPRISTHLCVDVGAFATAPSALRWWATNPKTFVVSVEANPVSYALLARADRPNDVTRCSSIGTSCTDLPWSHIRKNRAQFVPVHAAVGVPVRSAALALFRLGNSNRSDVGSLLQFRRRFARRTKAVMVGETVVPFVTLREVLRALRPSCDHLTWDTLKIDAQGADHLVVMSAFLDRESVLNEAAGLDVAYRNAADPQSFDVSRFGCIVGEFTNRAYTSSSETARTNMSALFGFRFRRALRLAGFAEVDERVWINARRAIVIERRDTEQDFHEYAAQFSCVAADEQRRPSTAFVHAIVTYRDQLPKR